MDLGGKGSDTRGGKGGREGGEESRAAIGNADADANAEFGGDIGAHGALSAEAEASFSLFALDEGECE